MTKKEARVIICRFAKLCLARGMSQSGWSSLSLPVYVEERHGTQYGQDWRKRFDEAHSLVGPEIWEHVGYWVWQPIRRDR